MVRGTAEPELGEQHHPGECGMQPCNLPALWHPAGGTWVAAGWGTEYPSHELWLPAREHPMGACGPVRRGATRRWSGAGDEPRDCPGAAAPGGGELGTQSL